MKRSFFLGFSIAGLAVATALSAFALNTAQAQEASREATELVPATGMLPKVPPQNEPGQVPASCSFCYTCGRDWPVWSGKFRSAGDLPTERGSQCEGALVPRSDSEPYLCCR
jgi:hypothetical protein